MESKEMGILEKWEELARCVIMGFKIPEES